MFRYDNHVTLPYLGRVNLHKRVASEYESERDRKYRKKVSESSHKECYIPGITDL